MSDRLMTAAQIKPLLGLEADDDTYDELFERFLPIVTLWFEMYCDRGLAPRDVVGEEVYNNRSRRVYVWAFPLTALTTVDADGELFAGSSYLVNSAAGFFMPGPTLPRIQSPEVMKITYTGGYPDASVPKDLASAFASAVGVQCGVPNAAPASSGGGAIKSIGLGGGALSVAFDTGGSSKGGVAGAYAVDGVPVALQDYADVLDKYCRQRL